MNRPLQTLKYILADLLSAFLAWGLFFFYRKYFIEKSAVVKEQILLDNNLYLGLAIIPVFWLVVYLFAGTYRRIYRKSRLKELGQTFIVSFLGVIVIFFAILIDDLVDSYTNYYRSVIVLFLLHFSITFVFRFVITSIAAYKIHNRKIGFNTVIIGSGDRALKIFQEIENQEKTSGNKFIGYVFIDNKKNLEMDNHLTSLGEVKELANIIKEQKIQEVIIAIETSEYSKLGRIISEISYTNVIIKVIPGMHDFLVGTVRMNSIFGTPLIQISQDMMPTWQRLMKRVIDIVFSLLAIVVLLPVYLFTAISVKTSSKGPILYSHYRIGKRGKPFLMHKFRSMYVDAEKTGPQLSSKNDPRITSFGRFMRKVRLDELPQFFTVLKGDMSLVGYRPERQYFIDKIVEKAPHYKLLLKIKPGITSWGQVKFGYAENVEEMVDRLKYDVLYLENMSLAVDFKIMIYTVLIVLQGRGK